MPKPYNAQLLVLSDWMGTMKQGKALSRQNRVLHRETKNILCVTASSSTAKMFVIARQQVLDAYLLKIEYISKAVLW